MVGAPKKIFNKVIKFINEGEIYITKNYIHAINNPIEYYIHIC